MRKAFVVAGAEWNAAVRSRAFIVSLVLLPVLMGGSIAAEKAVAGHTDTMTRRFAVIDPTGKLYDGLAQKTEVRNALVAGKAGRFVPEKVDVPAGDPARLDAVRLALSDRIRARELFAFVELPADALAAGEGAVAPKMRYYSDDPTYEDLRLWIGLAVSEDVRLRRLQAIGADPEVIRKLEEPLGEEALGLWTRAADGRLVQAAPVDEIRATIVPMALMFVVFLIVMTGAPQLLNSVLEEKMSRISEVLLGSVTPFELMLGKLIGSAGVSLLLGVIYAAGGLGVAAYLGYGNVLPLELVPWLLLFMLLAVFFFGSLYIAVGSACSELKDAQSLMMPVMLLTLMPIMVWTVVLKAPNSNLAVGFSLFPPATPFLMLLRLALHPGPPLWQAALSVVLTCAATAGCVWAAGKIFRTGVLMQGKAATFGQMLRWVLTR
jgi:ABC-2 type transport system permease protein